MLKKIVPFILLFAGIVSGCSTNAITGRSQLSLVSNQEMESMALTQYKQFLSQNKVVTLSTNKDVEMVKRVGSRIANAITQYYSSLGKGNPLAGYQWEFNLVDSKEVNAWCMPGGKVVVYTGLLPVTQNEASLAIVLGHEITHAVAEHGKEQYSQQLVASGLQSLGGVALSSNPTAKTLFNSLYGAGTQVGMMHFSRKDELEADHYGLIFAAMAGYNPQVAIPFWKRMAALSNGSSTPALLSSHPSDATRIAALEKEMPEALRYYKPIK
ncbi:M48 family metallopeptidase [Rhizosphaericola mali]|uniref:M48 family metallopeptidase n=1 Tax=Rhizosphaericola mali TaxID=2545455 RepID=A0A5P2G3L9_9BACT|nr:M48 family metallopeptidase [Rhizosphaericola mali]QES90424.1 M48 family metallopeptidase [Rhizosphaericola mali]